MAFLISPKFLRPLLSLLIFLTFDLMVLGAGVRSMDAGLACPDWPLCFGKVIPTYHFGVYLEFIHRAIAGVVGILFIIFYGGMFFNRKLKSLRVLGTLALFFLLSQIIMGGLTVLELLAYWTVTMHLMLATFFLGFLIAIQSKLNHLVDSRKSLAWNNLRDQKFEFSSSVPVQSAKGTAAILFFKRWSHIALGFMLIQLVLGGLVASTYSGLICVDFPTCNGQWIPTLKGPVGLQVWHRLGALALWMCLGVQYILSIRLNTPKFAESAQLRKLSGRAFLLVNAQIIVGILNLKWLLPSGLTILHSAFAILLFVQILQIVLCVRNTEVEGVPTQGQSALVTST